MNLTTLKQEARADLLKARSLDDQYAFLHTLIDKVVDAVEASVVPEEKDTRPEIRVWLERNRDWNEGWNDARAKLLEAFRNFRV